MAEVDDRGHPRLLVIVGSARRGRRAPMVADWVRTRVESRGDFAVDTVDVAELDLRDDLDETDERSRLRIRVSAASAVLVVTPEYNHSYPGPLKTLFDSVREPWRAKPVGFVAYGGVGGGLRAVEALRLVVAELHMVSVRAAVSIHGVRDAFEGGALRAPDIPAAAADEMLDQLAWWAAALDPARADRPYPG